MNENFMNKELIKQMLSELGKQTHMSSEVILAYARGVLSQDGQSKVTLHIKNCKECSEVFDFAKKFHKAEQELDSENLESKSTARLSPRVKSKLELVALLNSKKDELIKEIVKLFLPRDSWTYIEATIISKKNSKKMSSHNTGEDMHDFPVPTSSSTELPEDKLPPQEKCSILIDRIIDFVVFASELIMEQCEGIKDLEYKLAGCVDGAIVVLDAVKLDRRTVESVKKVFSDSLLSLEQANVPVFRVYVIKAAKSHGLLLQKRLAPSPYESSKFAYFYLPGPDGLLPTAEIREICSGACYRLDFSRPYESCVFRQLKTHAELVDRKGRFVVSDCDAASCKAQDFSKTIDRFFSQTDSPLRDFFSSSDVFKSRVLKKVPGKPQVFGLAENFSVITLHRNNFLKLTAFITSTVKPPLIIDN